jgi:hypothetical protein
VFYKFFNASKGNLMKTNRFIAFFALGAFVPELMGCSSVSTLQPQTTTNCSISTSSNGGQASLSRTIDAGVPTDQRRALTEFVEACRELFNGAEPAIEERKIQPSAPVPKKEEIRPEVMRTVIQNYFARLG